MKKKIRIVGRKKSFLKNKDLVNNAVFEPSLHFDLMGSDKNCLEM